MCVNTVPYVCYQANKGKKVSSPPAWSIFCQVKTHRQTDKIITKRYYDRKYIHMQTVMLLNMHKKLENMHIVIEALNYSKIDVETQFKKNKRPGGLVKFLKEGWTRNR